MNRSSDNSEDSDKYRLNYSQNCNYETRTENGENERKNNDEEEGNQKKESQEESEKNNKYLEKLLAERLQLDQNSMPKIAQLVEQEISKTMGKVVPKYVNVYREKPIKVSVKVLVPIKEHPKFNFVGKLLGPKGNTMKRLQEETMCKMSILGKGSMKDPQKEDELKASLDPKYSHLFENLHVEISAYGPPAEAHARIAYALAEIRKYLIPDNNDSIRQEQLREMEIITGTGVEKHRKSEDYHVIPRPPSVMRTATRMPVIESSHHHHHRVMPAKTKIMSILDRARIAMEDNTLIPTSSSSYDAVYEREYYEPVASSRSYPSYEPPPSPPPPSYLIHHRDEYLPPVDYRDYRKGSSSSSIYGEPSSHHRWKTSYRSNIPPSSSSSTRRLEQSSRYRSSPYSRPSK